MDETLKALQLAERALLALIGALLVFVISADRTTGPYEAALSELNVLQRTLPLIRQANIDEGRVAYASSNLAKIVADVAKKVTVDAQKVDYHVALSKNQMDSIPPMYYANSPQKIDDYYNYIKSAKFGGIRMFEFDEIEVRRELEKLFPLAGTKLTDIYIGPMQDEKYKEIPNQCQIGITINAKSKNNEVKETGPIKCQPPSWVSYKKSIEILAQNGLFIERDGYIFPLPAQSKVWDEVSGKEVQTAIGILERRSSAEISKRKGNVTAFGMTMEPNIAGLIGPALEIVLLLYLLALASQLSSAPASDFDKVANFPEIAILRTGAGSLLIILSIFVLPICATITLIVTSFQDVTLRYGYIMLFSVCWLALSGQFLHKLWQVARMPKPMVEVQ